MCCPTSSSLFGGDKCTSLTHDKECEHSEQCESGKTCVNGKCMCENPNSDRNVNTCECKQCNTPPTNFRYVSQNATTCACNYACVQGYRKDTNGNCVSECATTPNQTESWTRTTYTKCITRSGSVCSCPNGSYVDEEAYRNHLRAQQPACFCRRGEPHEFPPQLCNTSLPCTPSKGDGDACHNSKECESNVCRCGKCGGCSTGDRCLNDEHCYGGARCWLKFFSDGYGVCLPKDGSRSGQGGRESKWDTSKLSSYRRADACDRHDQCKSNNCLDWAGAGTNKHCGQSSLRDGGGACDFDFECEGYETGNLYCDTVNKRCAYSQTSVRKQDWQCYIDNHPDLKRALTYTSTAAQSHWNQYGNSEGRVWGC